MSQRVETHALSLPPSDVLQHYFVLLPCSVLLEKTRVDLCMYQRCLFDRVFCDWSVVLLVIVSFSTKKKKKSFNAVYLRWVGASFTPYLLINLVIVIFLLPLPLFSSFPCFFFVFFFCLCRTGFSQLCSPRRAFSEQGPLRLIKSASFFSGRRFTKRAATETRRSHAWVGVDAVAWVFFFLCV